MARGFGVTELIGGSGGRRHRLVIDRWIGILWDDRFCCSVCGRCLNVMRVASGTNTLDPPDRSNSDRQIGAAKGGLIGHGSIHQFRSESSPSGISVGMAFTSSPFVLIAVAVIAALTIGAPHSRAGAGRMVGRRDVHEFVTDTLR
jgi:hypothetical protein